MTATTLALIFILTSVAAMAFAMLQLSNDQRASGLVAAAGTLVLGALLLATQGDHFGISWMRETERRSDAIAFGVALPLLATFVGILAARRMRVTWSQVTLFTSSFACILGALVAIVIGRSTWYWEFAALVLGGLVLAGVGLMATLDRTATPNRRIVFGTFTAMGAFTTVGGTLLTLAWTSIG